MAAPPAHDDDEFPPRRPFGEPGDDAGSEPAEEDGGTAGQPPASAPAGAQPLSRS